MNEHLSDLLSVLKAARLRVSTEAALQLSIQETLDTAGLDYGREHSLSRRDRPDFMVGDIVLEAKARYPKKKIYKQLERYSEHERVSAIVLVTGTAMGMPSEINGKPVFIISVGMGMLGC